MHKVLAARTDITRISDLVLGTMGVCFLVGV